MTTNVTWSVTDVETGSILGQYGHNADDYPVTPAGFTSAVARAASQVNRHIIGAGYTLSTVAAVTDSVAYITAQDWAARLAACFIIRSTLGAGSDLAKELYKEVMTEMAAMVKTPSLLGATTSVPAQASTPVDRLGLSTDEAARAERRDFDDIRDRDSEADDPHGW